MARAGMANILLRTRAMIDDAGTATWTNDNLQDELDQYKMRVWREPLSMERTGTGTASYEYKVFHSRYGEFEEGGTAYFQIEASNGSQRGTADYTANYISGIVTMTTDQAGSELYLSGWSYDLNSAASNLWRQKAGNVSSYYDVQADGHKLSRSQWFMHCTQMSDMYGGMGRVSTGNLWTVGEFEV